MSKYPSEDKKNYYSITFEKIEEKEIKIIISDFYNKNKTFISKYHLVDLNTKFIKVIQFKTIDEFYHLLNNNVIEGKLIIKSPYRNEISSVWRIFPDSNENKKTFTLISSLNYNNKISLLFYSDFQNSEKVVKIIEKSIYAQNSYKSDEIFYSKISYNNHWLIDNMFLIKEKYGKEEDKIKDFKIIYKKALENKEKEEEKKVVLVMFETKDTLDNLISIIEEIYMHQPFIIIFTNKTFKIFFYEIKNKIAEELDDDILPYFDMDNIFIYKNNNEGYKKVIFSIIKVYRYFNQLGDSFFKQLPNKIYIENLDKEIQHLFFTHYFNILLCGRTGVGKSAFINKIMGEKKSFTLKFQPGTYRNNYYIHKKYPIKIIDVCGFAEGNEGKEIKKKLNAIYNQDTNDIIIDEPMNDIFTFYEDKRNNIHLLLYFTVFQDIYDILPGELPVILEAKEHNIPIIFIVNKCANELFYKPKKRKILDKEIERVRKDTDFKEYKTFYINCNTKRGFDELLQGIYNQFKNSIISDQNLEKIKNGEQEALNELFKSSFFFGNKKLENIFFNESLTNSVRDIKLLIVQIAGYYYNELGFLNYKGSKVYIKYIKNSVINFFPILANLLKKIYSNFGYNDKALEECNNFIKNKISEYFNINIKLEKEKIEKKKAGIKVEKETKNSEKTYKEKEEKEKKEKDDKKNLDKKQQIKEKQDKDYKKEKDKEKKEFKEKLICFPVTPETPQNKKEEEKIEEEEINIINNELLEKNETPIAHKFTIDQFQKDFINFGKLFWNLEQNFHITDNIEENNLNHGKGLEEKIFSFDDKNIIDPIKIIQLVKKDFGLEDSQVQACEREKIVLILFYISYTCKELISSLCGEINKKGFIYKSICNFFYIVSKLYNNAIEGFINIKKDLEKEEKNQNIYESLMKGHAAPHS